MNNCETKPKEAIEQVQTRWDDVLVEMQTLYDYTRNVRDFSTGVRIDLIGVSDTANEKSSKAEASECWLTQIDTMISAIREDVSDIQDNLTAISRGRDNNIR